MITKENIVHTKQYCSTEKRFNKITSFIQSNTVQTKSQIIAISLKYKYKKKRNKHAKVCSFFLLKFY